MNRKLLAGLSIGFILVFILMVVGLGLSFITSMFSSSTKSFSQMESNSEGNYQIERMAASSSRSYDKISNAQDSERVITSPHSEPNPIGGSSSNIPMPQGMFFLDYGTNIFIDTSIDTKSTFGLDVDTASYTIAKNYIMKGNLPPTSAIRSEEFINYFDYNYKNPETELGIYSQLSTSPFGEEFHFLTIGIKSKDLIEDTRKPVNLMFIIDVSGSMNTGNRLGLVKKSLLFLLENLEEGDNIGIVTYNTNAKKLLDYTSIDNKAQIETILNSLSAGGSTNVDAGLKLGYDLASKQFDKEYINRVILLSDGVANTGETDPDAMINKLKDYKDQGIAITCIGVGLGNYNDVLLEKIANKGDGNYFYINEFDEAQRIFSKELTKNLQIRAKDAKIQVDFDFERVESYRLIGYENRAIADEEFRNDEKDAGELGAGHEATAVYEVRLKESANDLGVVYLRYKTPEDDLSHETSHRLPSQVTDFNNLDANYRLSIIAARFAQILKLTAPPPQIEVVEELLKDIEISTYGGDGFPEMVYNAKGLIKKKQ